MNKHFNIATSGLRSGHKQIALNGIVTSLEVTITPIYHGSGSRPIQIQSSVHINILDRQFDYFFWPKRRIVGVEIEMKLVQTVSEKQSVDIAVTKISKTFDSPKIIIKGLMV